MSDEPLRLSDRETREQQPRCKTCGGVLEYIISPYDIRPEYQCNSCNRTEILAAIKLFKSQANRCPVCGGTLFVTHGKDKYWCKDCEQYSTLAELRANYDWMPVGDDEPVGGV